MSLIVNRQTKWCKSKRLFCNSAISACFILFISTVSAQSSNSTFSLLAHAGVSGTQVQGDGLGGFDKLGFMFGLGVEMGVGKRNAIGFEINLLQKGSKKAINPETNSDGKYKMVLTYIQVPVYFNYGITDKIYVLAGPAIGFLVASKEVDINGPYTPNPPFNTFDFSGIFGAQYKFTDRLKAEIRLDQSLTSIRTKGSSSSNYLIGKQYNTSLGIYLCFTMK